MAERAQRVDIEEQLRHSHEQLRQSHEQLRRISARARARREEDRTRVARELHDQLGQALAGLKIGLYRVGQQIGDGRTPDEDLTSAINAMMRLVDDTIWRVRRLSSELRPPVLDKLGLIAALEAEAQEFEARTHIRARVSCRVKQVKLDAGRARAVFRIVQEALTNVASHANASRVTVGVATPRGQLRLTIADNGCGIRAEDANGRDSLGLLGMHERASLLDGIVSVRQARSRGTEVTISFPLAERRRVPRGGLVMINVLVADDHPVVRQGIRQIVGDTDDIKVVDEATNGREALQHARQSGCDVVLLDLSLPDVDGLDLIKQLRQERPEMAVLVLTMHSEDQFALRALKAGASGYLTKESAPGELVGAVRRVVAGGRYISVGLAERLASHLGPDGERAPHERLSDREYQVLRMIASGKTTRQISNELALSIKTVGTYRARLLDKMQMSNTAELTAYAVRRKLVEEK